MVFSAGNNPSFPGISYYGSHRSRGNFSTFCEIDIFLLVVSSLTEHLFDEASSGMVSDLVDVRRVRSTHDNERKLGVSESLEQMMKYFHQLEEYCLGHVDEVVSIFAPGNRPRAFYLAGI